jgi:hypothetical protein
MTRFNTVLFLGVLVLAACGGSGGGDDPDPVVDAGGGVPKSGVSASFTPNNPNPGADNTVWMDQASAVGDTITVAIRITDTGSLHTAGFDVIFDDVAMDYLGYNQGSLFEQGGNAPTYQVGSQPGRIVVGISRSGSSETAAVGSKTAIELVFTVNAAGTWPVTLANYDLLDSNVTVIPGISWWGGNAVAN